MRILYTGSVGECDLLKVALDLEGIPSVITNATGGGGYSCPDLRVTDQDFNAARQILAAFQETRQSVNNRRNCEQGSGG